MSDRKPAARIRDLVDFGNSVVEGIVTSVRPLGTTKNGKQWFSFVLDDGDCDIKVSVFNRAPDFFGQVRQNTKLRVENITVRLKSAEDKKYDTSSSEYTIMLSNNSKIEILQTEVSGATASTLAAGHLKEVSTISAAKDACARLLPPDALDTASASHAANIVAGVLSAQFLRSSSEAARPWTRLDLAILDDTDRIKVALWNDSATDFLTAHALTEESVAAGLAGKVLCFLRLHFKHTLKFGTQASIGRSTQVLFPDDASSTESYKRFAAWWDSPEGQESRRNALTSGPSSPTRNTAGESADFSSYPLETIRDARRADGTHRIFGSIILDRKADFATYYGCSACKRAIRDQGDVCQSCGPSAKLRHFFRIPAHVADATGHMVVSVFDPYASQILGLSADDFQALEDPDKEDALSKSLEAELLVRFQMGMDGGRDRINVVSLSLDPNYADILGLMLSDLYSYATPKLEVG